MRFGLGGNNASVSAFEFTDARSSLTSVSPMSILQVRFEGFPQSPLTYATRAASNNVNVNRISAELILSSMPIKEGTHCLHERAPCSPETLSAFQAHHSPGKWTHSTTEVLSKRINQLYRERFSELIAYDMRQERFSSLLCPVFLSAAWHVQNLYKWFPTTVREGNGIGLWSPTFEKCQSTSHRKVQDH